MDLKVKLKRFYWIIKLHGFKFFSLSYSKIEKKWKSSISQENKKCIGRIKDKILNSERKLHIVFYVCERSKWNSQSIYERFKNHPKIRITFALDENDVAVTKFVSKARAREINKKNYEFYKTIDLNVVRTFDDNSGAEFTKLEDLDPDIIFYQQPWGEMGRYPAMLLGKSLSIYIPYFYLILDWDEGHFNRVTFNCYLWKYFAQTELHRKLHLEFDSTAESQIVVAGYPKLDVFFDNISTRADHYWKQSSSGKKRVIYAPHHSVGDSNLKMSTFAFFHKEFLELAQRNPNYQWVYKPHPTIAKSVVQFGVMTEEEYHAYESKWDSLPNASVNKEGNYFDLFKTSDAMITDCVSFLAEYLPTKHPILQLVRSDSIGLNEVGRNLTRDFYKAQSFSEVESFLEAIVLSEQDNMLEKRMNALNSVMPFKERSAEIIVKYILDEFEIS